MTQRDIIHTFGVNRSFVSNIENEKTNSTLAIITKITKALDVSIEELIK